MKLVDIITQAQMISGIGVFEGNAVDQNLMATSLVVFHQTLNAINNDPKLNLIQSKWDYQTDVEENPNFPETIPGASNPDSNSWINIPQLNDDEPSEPIDTSELNLKFPNRRTPFSIASTYPLPSDCRRPLKVLSGTVELRKTDFSEIERNRRVPGMMNLFAVNNRELELIFPGKAILIYVKEFKEFMPQDEVDLPHESLDYVINLLSYNLALSFNRDSVSRCQLLAEKSYNALLANHTVNLGEKYQSIYNSMNRFSGRGGPWL
jgi:hypothetical protein